MTNPIPERLAHARGLLHRHFGYSDFRPAQRRVVAAALAGRDVLAVMPTGAGKSVCFQVPALASGGLAIVVSPLISLMQDQVAALHARQIPAAALTGTLSASAQRKIVMEAAAGRISLLYAAPERLARLSRELAAAGTKPSLFAIDEAHCIAEWGHDFRPAYRTLRRIRWAFGAPPTIALTGSATPSVRQDIISCLGLREPAVLVGSFDRANLWFGVRRVVDDHDRLEVLLRLLREADTLAIVYAPTRNTTEGIVRALTRAGFRTAPYHAGLSKEARAATLDRFLAEQLEVVVATCAFGMGIDQPRVRLVVHWTMPPTPESYYQEAGRSGRDGGPARCILLWHPDDARLHRRQLEVTFPPRKQLQRIWYQAGGRSGIPANVLSSADRLARELHPERGHIDWRGVERRSAAAQDRLKAMASYAESRSCRRAELLRYFGEPPRGCSGCDRCDGRGHTPAKSKPVSEVDPGVESAIELVRERLQTLEDWRAGVARAGGLPTQCVVPDRVLRRVATAGPSNRDDLRAIPGVGPRLLAKWGEDVLRRLRRVE